MYITDEFDVSKNFAIKTHNINDENETKEYNDEVNKNTLLKLLSNVGINSANIVGDLKIDDIEKKQRCNSC